MAIEKYRVLAHMVRSPKFTVESIEKATGVKSSSIRTVIERYRSFIESTPMRTGRRGGQGVLYSLKPNRQDEVRKELESLFQVDDRGLDFSALRQTEEAPLELAAAEFLINRRFAEAPIGSRKQILAQAEKNLRSVERKRGHPESVVPDHALYLANAFGTDIAPTLHVDPIDLRLASARARLSELSNVLDHGSESDISEFGARAIAVCPATEADAQIASLVRGIFQGQGLHVRWVEAAQWEDSKIFQRIKPIVFGLDSQSPDHAQGFLDRLHSATELTQFCVVDAGLDQSLAAKVKSARGCYVPNAENLSYKGLVAAIVTGLGEVFGISHPIQELHDRVSDTKSKIPSEAALKMIGE